MQKADKETTRKMNQSQQAHDETKHDMRLRMHLWNRRKNIDKFSFFVYILCD